MLFGSVNALKNIMLSGLFLMVLSVFVPATNAQTASNSQQSQQSANASQRAEIFAALVSLNEKYKISALTILEAGETTPLTTGYKVTTKLDGSASFNLGAKLSMAGDKDYVDGVYSGTYSVKVSY